ncbi:ferritin-like domain-containing protein [Kitasatospora sp. NPDC097605]|uniref:ferritin-like domain-containing protein n=1 Tax=Kitasatospora sp. NPDC097605 TaxID=3157226 RepID=UPI0033212D31
MQPPSRRTLLTLGLLLTAGATLTACTDGHADDPTAPAGDHRRPDPDEPVRLRAVAATDTLLAGYDALLPQAPQLQPLRAEVAQHRAALQPTTTTPPTTPAASPSTPPPTLAALAALERQTAQSRLADLGAASPQLARLLASVSAAGVLHAVTLGDPAPGATPTPTPTPGEPATAFQDALGAEHAAIYGYGVVGARLTDDQQRTDARTTLAAHQSRRDAWQRLLTSTGATPTAAAPGYQLPFPVTDAPTATRLAAHLETRLTTVYADLVAAAPAPHRPLAADALRDSALRAHHWGATPTPFPGFPTTPTPSTT